MQRISGEEVLRDPYEVLGLKRDATQDEIRKAYRSLAIKFHPDKNPGDNTCTDKFKEVSDAYEILGNPQAKAQFDTYGKTGSVNQGKPFTSVFDDMFSQLFSERRRATQRGEHIVVEVPVTLKQVLTGEEIQVSFVRRSICKSCQGFGGSLKTCNHCEGTGAKIIYGKAATVRTSCHACNGAGKMIGEPCVECDGGFSESLNDSIKFAMPPGVENGMRFSQKGLGHPSTHPQGIPGDLYLIIKVLPHDPFERTEGGNLHLKLPFSYTELVFGCELEVPTLEGIVKIKIPPGTQPAAKFRLKEMGLPVFNGSQSIYGRGDQYIHVKLQVPTELSDRQKELFEELATLEQPQTLTARELLIEKLGE